MQVPRRFWKIAAWATKDSTGSPALAATGYLLDQTALLDVILSRQQRTVNDGGASPEFGAFLTYQVPLVDIATLTGLNLGPLLPADRLSTTPPAPATTLRPGDEPVSSRWTPLRQLSDLQL